VCVCGCVCVPWRAKAAYALHASAHSTALVASHVQPCKRVLVDILMRATQMDSMTRVDGDVVPPIAIGAEIIGGGGSKFQFLKPAKGRF
jgi:hypothetical protein